ncbi:glycosyltransferase [Actimicrobium antarcticum]|uniref:Glycosyltransferase family 4 protein n=1 Tax=Actimicrobium antarcticum TaxID=1051899 RepID=A0ABP7U297_9BURK
MSPLRILTWQTPDSYLYYLSQLPHQFHVITDAAQLRGQRSRRLNGDNVHPLSAEQARHEQFDCILFQQPCQYLEEQYLYLNAAQRQLPRIYLEHSSPGEHPTDMRHPVDDPSVLLVHVTAFNELMWDNGRQATRVIEYGAMPAPDVQYSGERPCGLVLGHPREQQGRRLGGDIYRRLGNSVPLEWTGTMTEVPSGDGESIRHQLPVLAAQCRFLFHSDRYNSLNLAVIEAMMIGMPIIGLATGEMASVIQNGVSGYVDTNLQRLETHMQELLDDPHYAYALGRGAQRRARERFGMHRFLADWCAVLKLVTGKAA